MKLLILFISLFTTLTFASFHQTYTLKVVDDSKYNSVKKLKKNKDVAAITKLVTIEVDPGPLMPSLSTKFFKVCNNRCDDEKAEVKPSKVYRNGNSEFIFDEDTVEFRQVNVFYHVLQTVQSFQKMGISFDSSKPFSVFVDAIYTDYMKKKGKMSHNAFFNDQDNSLSFIDSKKAIIYYLSFF